MELKMSLKLESKGRCGPIEEIAAAIHSPTVEWLASQ